MKTRLTILMASLAVLGLGCTPPNTPEPDPPPPKMTATASSTEPVLPSSEKQGEPTVETEPGQAPRAEPYADLSIDQLVIALGRPDERNEIASALAGRGKAAVPAIEQALEHPDWQVRAAAVFALGQIGKDAAPAKTKLAALVKDDENSTVRDAATFALDAINDPQ